MSEKRVPVCVDGCGRVADPKQHFLDTGHTIEWREVEPVKPRPPGNWINSDPGADEWE